MTEIVEYRYNVNGLLEELIYRNGDVEEITRWEYGTTLSPVDGSGIASGELIRAKIYSASASDRVNYVYNRAGGIVKITDQNGTVHEDIYDGVGRVVADKVTNFNPDGDIDQSVQAMAIAFTPRGEWETITSYSNTTLNPAHIVNQIGRSYNGFGQVVVENQNHVSTSSDVTYVYETPVSAPNSIRRKNMIFDGQTVLYESLGNDAYLDRVSRIRNTTGTAFDMVGYTRIGMDVIVRTQYNTDFIEMTAIQQPGGSNGDGGDRYVGLDRFGRLESARWLDVSTGTPTDLERIEYGFDRVGNRNWRRNLLAPSENFDEKYERDFAYQLNQLTRGKLNQNRSAIAGVPIWSENYEYDPLGNWLKYQTSTSGSVDLTQSRLYNAANQLVHITDLGLSPSVVAQPLHDRAGNFTRTPATHDWTESQSFVWDAWNRPVKVIDDGGVVAEYGYDGLHRRIQKTVGAEIRHLYYDDAWHVTHERVMVAGDAKRERQFFWGLKGLDDLVMRNVYNTGTGALAHRHWAISDGKNITAAVELQSSVPTVVERYAYHAFGFSEVLEADFDGKPDNLSTIDWETRFCGYRYDDETGLYQVRYRFYHSGLGRWLSRDPIMEAGGINLYAYVANSPIDAVDPMGLQIMPGMIHSQGQWRYDPSANPFHREPPKNKCTKDATHTKWVEIPGSRHMNCAEGSATKEISFSGSIGFSISVTPIPDKLEVGVEASAEVSVSTSIEIPKCREAWLEIEMNCKCIKEWWSAIYDWDCSPGKTRSKDKDATKDCGC